MPERGIDVLIRGAGPVGCTLALGLRGSGLEVAVLDVSTAKSSFRPIALSYASRLILERIGAWQGLASTPIETIHVSQRGGFGQTRRVAIRGSFRSASTRAPAMRRCARGSGGSHTKAR